MRRGMLFCHRFAYFMVCGSRGICPFVTTLSLREKCSGTNLKSAKAAFSLSADIFQGVPQGHISQLPHSPNLFSFAITYIQLL